ncbi:autotransporter outer membrane beta-barrel domain-containing protein [Yersinia rohdei]|uniref:autotransporter outer membrane beta-barrel domain-containing protein n=1 Tax=Yersinia rohdei TaxID=29485 RepID=UPI0025AA5F82|nr:autotransporter outer membrane beta-barrel domain-containing protein [Yersinia rohdei]MDN0092777.1 autotransporter outer membrane beta-barrel domain-containing protein [Yersinia rohdei]
MKSCKYKLSCIALTIAAVISPTFSYADIGITGDVIPDIPAWDIPGVLIVGNAAEGSLEIFNGGTLTSGNEAGLLWSYIGYAAGVTGLMSINGSNSKWVNNGAILVGFNGMGTLQIVDGGVVNNPTGATYIGFATGSTGNLNVSGVGSQLVNGGELFIGNDGEGSVTVSNGGSLSSVGSYIGFASGSKGSVLITGANTNWTNAGEIHLGENGGNAALTINNSGAVQTNSLTIANDITSTAALNIGSAVGATATSAGYIDTPLITLGSGDGSIVFNHTDSDYQFNSAIAGSGKVAVYSGTTVLNGINSYSGTTTINAGTLKAGAANSFSAASDYIVDSLGELDLVGFNQTLKSLNNSGTVSLNGVPGTLLTISGDYIGNDGVINFNSVLNNDTSVTDKLVVNGNTSGVTRVGVTNLGGSGATTLNGIELIEVNGLSAGEFVKQGRIVAGAYDYSLVRGIGANASNWYLANTEIAAPSTGTTGSPLMIQRPEAGSYATNLAAANNMFVTSLNDRMGETQYIDVLTGEHKTTSMWLRNEGGHNRSRDTENQLNTQANRYVLQLGGDIAQWSSNTTDRFHLGLMAGYANSKSTTVSQITGYSAKGSVDGYSTGVYGTWYANEAEKSGLYVDSWAQYSWFNNTVNGQDLEVEEYKAKGVTASLESGYTVKIGENAAKNATYFIQPKAQVTWMGVKSDDYQESNGTHIAGEGDGNIQTRLGVKAFMNGYSAQDKGKGRVFQPFVEANWVHNTKDFGTIMDNVTVKQAGAANIAELKVGVEGQINKNVNLWGNVGQQVGNKGYSDTAVILGVKYNF